MTIESIEVLSNIEKTEIIFNIIQSALTAIAIIVGGFWAYFRFIRQRENNALIDFNVDITFHSMLNDDWIIELIAYIENKGKVQHRIYNFDFKLEYLAKTDKVVLTSKENQERGQVKFKKMEEGSFMRKSRLKQKEDKNTKIYHKLFKTILNKRKNEYFYFIEPGLKNKYSYITKVPSDTDILLLHSWFEYPDVKYGHIAEITKKVPLKLE